MNWIGLFILLFLVAVAVGVIIAVGSSYIDEEKDRRRLWHKRMKSCKKCGYSLRGGQKICPECGSPLTLLEPHRPKLIFIQASSLDDPSVHSPTMDIFTKSAQRWDCMNPELEKYSGMPPIPDEFGR